ncbi:hypothetical protein YB2330_001669 [Saitoella coloradoensis]
MPTAVREGIIRWIKAQYLSLVDARNFQWVPPTWTASEAEFYHLLAEPDVQASLSYKIFAENAVNYPPPPRYRSTILKQLISLLEPHAEEIDDGLYEIYTELIASSQTAGGLSDRIKPSHVTYLLDSGSGSDADVDTKSSSSSSMEVTLMESRSLLASSGTTGLRTWEAALALGEYLLQPSIFLPLLQGKSVLELGAGTGFIGILSAMVGAPKRVCMTDGSDEVVDGVVRNIALNGLEDTTCMVTAKRLWWGTDPVPVEDEDDWDVVLGADVTYDAAVVPSLVATIAEVLERRPGALVLIAATIRNEETFAAFERACDERGFRRMDVDMSCIPRVFFYSKAVPIRIVRIQT